jgi:hypothetical protein
MLSGTPNMIQNFNAPSCQVEMLVFGALFRLSSSPI